MLNAPIVAAKINVALLVGERRPDGYHDVATVMQRIDVRDRVTAELAAANEVVGFPADTIVRRALELLAEASGSTQGVRVTIHKTIPLAAGLAGGSADAAAALVLANELLERPLSAGRLHELAARLGADVPFFLVPGAKLAEGIGERLTPLELPRDYAILLARDRNVTKPSTGEIYARFDAAGGGAGFAARRRELVASLAGIRCGRDLALLPANDLAAASGAAALVPRLLAVGAFRADVSGAGPTVYGLFAGTEEANAAAAQLGPGLATTVTGPID